MGADVMRWQFCAQPPDRNLLFGFGPGREIKAKLLRLWNSVRVLVLYGNIAEFRPAYGDLAAPGVELEFRPLDRWLVERTAQLAAEATAAYEAYRTVDVLRAFESFVDDLSNWYIRRSRPRFWDGDEAALRTLWFALVQSLRLVAPIMPFLAEHLWQNLVRDADGDVPDSIFLAGWPELDEPGDALLVEMAEVRRVVELARQARSSSGLKLRQPLRRLVIQGAPSAEAHRDEIADELRVKEVQFGPVEAAELRVKPNLPVLGPKLGRELGAVRSALEAGEFEQVDGGRFRVAGHELGPDEVLVERRPREGWAMAEDDGYAVALATDLDDELRREGRVYDLIHTLNAMRKEAGLELTDRITIILPRHDSDLLEHEDWIKREVLALSLGAGDVAQPVISKA
jgi:isoleucyl-tRNA synthetase